MHVVLLGTRPETLSALISSGHEVTVLYENTERDRRRIAPHQQWLRGVSVISSYFNIEALWSALHHTGAVNTGVDAIVPVLEDAVMSAAVLGELLDARAIKPATALRCRDKSTQKIAWQEAGISTARHVVATGAQQDIGLLAESAGMRAPFVIKPTAGFGAMNTVVVETLEQLNSTAAELAEAHPALAQLLVEERNPGGEWIIDGVVLGGNVRWLMLTKYCVPMIECSISQPVRLLTLTPETNPQDYAYATRFTQDAVDALGLYDSTFHFEVFGEPGNFVAGELAARPGGGMLPATMHRLLGVNLWACAAQVVTGDAPQSLPTTSSNSMIGYCGLPITPGSTNHVTESDLYAIPGIVEVEMNIPTGGQMPDSRIHSGVQIAGVLSEGKDADECLSVLDDAITLARRINN